MLNWLEPLLSHKSLLCHLGGDRFCILLHQETDSESAKGLCLKIQHVIHASFIIQGATLSVTATIGCSLFSSRQD